MKYGLIIANKSGFEPIDLLRVPHKNGILTVSHPAFGPIYFRDNIISMKESYSHPQTRERISFRNPNIAESISAAVYNFENLAKPQILDSGWLQLGWIVKTPKGVFANPPKDIQGNPITDEKILKSYLDSAKKVNGIYLCENDFGFAPYESFKQGVQDCDTFAEGGLARLLEHADGKTAENLMKIASPKFYKRGVNISGFGKTKKNVLKVASLYSDRNFDINRLGVSGSGWDDLGNGYAFGVLDSAEGATKNK